MPSNPAACSQTTKTSFCNTFAGRLFGLTIALLLMPSASLGASCDAVTGAWAPTRYYEQGSVVVFNGDWYEARERHSGRQPTSGLFTWQAVAAPDCDSAEKSSINGDASPETSSGISAAEQALSETFTAPDAASQKPDKSRALPQAQPCQPFSFGQSYLVGQQVEHEGKIYRAIRSTTGTLPGRAMPHHWEITEQPCTR